MAEKPLPQGLSLEGYDPFPHVCLTCSPLLEVCAELSRLGGAVRVPFSIVALAASMPTV